MIIQIRITVDIPKEDELTYTVSTENVIHAVTQTVYEHFPHIKTDVKHPSVSVVFSKLDDLKDVL